MITLTNDKTVSFDVDDTLIMWPIDFGEPGEGRVQIDEGYFVPHEKHIERLKAYNKAGWTVIVWSMGGSAWARKVVDALKLTPHVKLVMGKPLKLYDDLPLNEALGSRHYISLED